MAVAAVLRAEDVIKALFPGGRILTAEHRRFEPDLRILPRHGVALHAENGDVQGVRDVFGDELQHHRPIDLEVQLVRFGPIGILEIELPLAGLNVHDVRPCRRDFDIDVVHHPQGKKADDDEQRNDGPEDFQRCVVRGAVFGCCPLRRRYRTTNDGIEPDHQAKEKGHRVQQEVEHEVVVLG